jgi:hypothetical protein
MAVMYQPTIREVSPPNGQYVHWPLMYGGLPCIYVYANVCMALANMAVGINQKLVFGNLFSIF